MWLIGLTGGIGSGKSSVASWFRERKVPILDADAMVRHLLQEDAETISLIRDAFGPETVAADGQVERRKLGRIVFQDGEARRALEKIVHPRIEKVRLQELKALEELGQSVAIWDVPLLFENNLQKQVQETLLVWIPLEVQIARVQSRDGLNREEVMARIKAQMSLSAKAELADVMIDNSGAWANTEQQLSEYWQSLETRNLVGNRA